jgi:hypothetical protein
MSAVLRSPERLSAVPMDRPETGSNQRRVEEAFRLLGMVAARIAVDPNPSIYVFDLASRDGILQEVWCREELSATTVINSISASPADISDGAFGLANAERHVRAQKALSTLMLDLARPGCDGSASLRVRGLAGEFCDDIRAESRRQWRF